MTNEEMQSTMHFILNHQAQLTAKVDGMASNLESLATKVNLLAEKVDILAAAQLNYETRTGRLEDSFGMLVQLVTNMDERMDTMTEAQVHTDERLSAFITTVERYISEGRNGHS